MSAPTAGLTVASASASSRGEAAYLRAVARHTTTERPAEIHQLGVQILDDLDRDWSSLGARALGIAAAPDVRAALRSDPSLRFGTSPGTGPAA